MESKAIAATGAQGASGRRLWRKKRRHERSSCSCREASDANYFQPRGWQALPPPQLEYIHHSIDLVEVKYKNRNYFLISGERSFEDTYRLNKSRFLGPNGAIGWRPSR